MEFIGWLLGLDNVTSIEGTPEISLSSQWAKDGPFWVFLGVVCLFAVSLLFYVRFQQRGGLGIRIVLGFCRATVLTLLLLTLAVPVLHATYKTKQLPYVYVVIDGTDSMAIEDQLTEQQRQELADAVGLDAAPDSTHSRSEYLQALLRKDANVLQQLSESENCRVEVFLFDGETTSRARKLDLNAEGDRQVDPRHLADQLTTAGQVTAVGNVLNDIAQQFGTSNLSGVVLFSDFANNSGATPLDDRSGRGMSPAKKLGVPIYTVGVGVTEALDLAVDLQTDPKMKKAERTNIVAKLRHTGLDGRMVNVRVTARPLTGQSKEILVGEKSVTLAAGVDTVEFPFTPEDSGRFEFIAEVEPLEGEVVNDNNRATREVNIIDDFLRLMYVANEPSWEWRFIKEVFHRDKLVGLDGFRTYLSSSDARVRESNILFLPTMTPKRSEFFANDVIFIGDMPGGRADQPDGLSPRFMEMTREYVSKFGGGLVVICGPRFGLRHLHETPLADMLPVIIDPDADIRDDAEFPLKLTALASTFPFMNLGDGDVENAQAWQNLARLQWYQPVANAHDLAEVLAVHPTDTCQDGETPQPLIAVRRYGKGEVVYIGFNEMWRLRRQYGEKYYRQFWSQLIYRLGMSHALGSEKRFVPRVDRQQYRVDEKVTLTVEAFDENFEPLDDEQLENRTLDAELIITTSDGGAEQIRAISIPALRKGVFEARIPVFTDGEYRVRIKDPVTKEYSEVRFDVADASAERRSGIRNRQLQEQLAVETRGRSYELTNVADLIDDLNPQPVIQHTSRTHPLWNTPIWFILVVGLLLGEWATRKMVNLT